MNMRSESLRIYYTEYSIRNTEYWVQSYIGKFGGGADLVEEILVMPGVFTEELGGWKMDASTSPVIIFTGVSHGG